jgi:hypothetical protein
MRRRDFLVGLLFAAAVPSVPAQEQAKQHRIAIIATGPVSRIHDPQVTAFHAFFEELRRLGDVEGENLTVDPYSGGGRPGGYAELADEVVKRNPDVIVASTNAITQAVRAAANATPIVWIGGDPVQAGFATSLARPGGNINRRYRQCRRRNLGEASPDPEGSGPFGIQDRVLDNANGLAVSGCRTTASGGKPTTASLTHKYARREFDPTRDSACVHRDYA